MRALAVVFLLVLVLVPAAAAHGDEEQASIPARDLALQALAILDQGGSHELAMEKLELALESTDTSGVDLSIVRLARSALSEELVAEATSLMERAFTDDEQHVVGASLQTGLGTGQIAAVTAGAVLLVLAVVGLASPRLKERRAALR